ncbi:MAG TPA: hypothetical protein DD473_16860 [Planctomycetaceae bacterium]|nr:hypothetical protein [Planctomycetaceae bacterium]|tara:strand:- start:273 stop:977 length:705 start_codon:yes stop_codon:yes gene_type:complete
MTATTLTVRELRRMWKPHKERLAALHSEHPTNVRFHRACSWLQRSEETPIGSDLDITLMSQWIAMNALYGQWDSLRQEPVGDLKSWKDFLDRMLKLDQQEIIINTLNEQKSLVMSILEDPFLSRYFWKEPCPQQANRSRKTLHEARTWYLMGNWALILDRVVERIYFLRCQIVHGAATYDSQLNRSAIQLCTELLDPLIRSFLLIWAQRGVEEDWGGMCYPPQSLEEMRVNSTS